MRTKAEQVVESPVNVLRSGITRRCLVALGSFVFAAFLIEFPALIGVFDYRTVIGPEHLWWGPNRTDPELLQIRRPYAHQRGSARGGLISWGYEIPPADMTLYQWDVTYDRNGFRNQSNLQRADIAVIGDSFVEGLTIPTEQLTTFLLSKHQNNAVANLGQSAYGPQQELLVLKRYGLPLRPRTVVWMFSESSDLGDVISYRNLITHPPSFWQAFYHRSFTRNSVKEIKRLLFHPVKPSGIKRSGLFRASDGRTVTLYFVSPSAPFTNEDLGALEETTRTIADAHGLCAAQGIHFVFVFIPTKFRVFHDFCQFPQESECRNWGVNDLPERMRKAVRSISSEIGYIDLIPYLRAAVKGGALPYYPDDDHWSPEGHKIAAEAIRDYLALTPE